jgi:glyoxylase-like metal-dependent hydrolase (beta-lactamase superfamily II)
MANLIDVMHLGRDRVIGANELPGGIIIDPGPTTGLDALLAGLAEEPRALLLTHIHLDHAGAAGVLARTFPGLRVYVHEVGAPHLAEPEKLLKSARRLYGDDMDRLWGEFAPVPADRIVALGDEGQAEGLRYAHVPGHASHHVAYFDESTGDAFTGDTAGVRIPPSDVTVAPTPPPDVDLDAWRVSIERIRAWSPERVVLTHFGPFEAAEQLDATSEALRLAAEWSRDADLDSFLAARSRSLAGASDDLLERADQAVPPDQAFAGLERYWRKRREREERAG